MRDYLREDTGTGAQAVECKLTVVGGRALKLAELDYWVNST